MKQATPTQQLEMFPGSAPLPASTVEASVLPADVDTETARLGADLPHRLFLGTSSWSFPGWQGLVYAKHYTQSVLAHEGLRAYSAHPVLRVAGIDRGFYAPLAAADFARYAAQVPEGFRFLVKAPSAVTDAYKRGRNGEALEQNERFLEPKFAAEQFIGPCIEGLGARAGPLVFQFSPLGLDRLASVGPLVEQMHAFLAALRRDAPRVTLAVEVRDRELLGADFVAALNDTATRYAFSVHARMPSVSAQAAALSGLAPGTLVARWMLHAGYGYEEARAHYAPFNRLVDEDLVSRRALARLASEALGAGREAFIIAGNKAEGSAPLTAVELARSILDDMRHMEHRLP